MIGWIAVTALPPGPRGRACGGRSGLPMPACPACRWPCCATATRPGCRHPVPVRRGLGDRHLCLFRRARRSAARNWRRRFRRARRAAARSAALSAAVSPAGLLAAAAGAGDLACLAGGACAFDRRPGRRPVRILGQAAAWRKDFGPCSFPAMAASWTASTGLSRLLFALYVIGWISAGRRSAGAGVVSDLNGSFHDLCGRLGFAWIDAQLTDATVRTEFEDMN